MWPIGTKKIGNNSNFLACETKKTKLQIQIMNSTKLHDLEHAESKGEGS